MGVGKECGKAYAWLSGEAQGAPEPNTTATLYRPGDTAHGVCHRKATRDSSSPSMKFVT